MKKFKNIDFIQIYILILLIITSGSIYCSYIYYKEFLIVLFISAIVINKKRSITRSSLFIFIIFSIIFLLNYFTWGGNVDGYIGIIIKAFSVLLLANNIDKNKFMKYYVYFFSVYIYISLISYYTLLNNWAKVQQIPVQNVWGSQMRATILYTFPEYEFYRNFGFYKEGGMYAIFINIALLFSYKIKATKWVSFSRFMFIITIATTLSTSGLIAAFIIIIFYSFKNKTHMVKKIITFIVLLTALMIIEMNLGIINNKFSSNNVSFKDRASEISISMNILEDNLWVGTGYQNAESIKQYTYMTMTNGVLSVFIQFGLFIGSAILILYFYGIAKNINKKLDRVIISILFLFFSASQPVIYQPIFLLLLLGGTINSNMVRK